MIRDKYRVEGVLGRGGMGIVLKARHLRLDEPVAIKVLHASLTGDPEMSARLMREARATLRLQSEHVVRVMDVDTLEDNTPFIVLEYLEGIDLATLRRRRGATLPWEEAVAIADQVCRALIEAHSLGIVHRDLKPANLFLVDRPDGRRLVKLLDFGISKLHVPGDAPITRLGDILGSPRYMAPEQVRGDPIDGRADLWALGVVLYEIVSGVAPFAGDNFASSGHRVLEETPAPLSQLRPDLPAGLSAVVERCLQKDLSRRFRDATELHEALAPFTPALRTGSYMAMPELGRSAGIHPADPDAVTRPSSSEPLVAARPGEPIPLVQPYAHADPSGASLSADMRAPPKKGRSASRIFLWVALLGLAAGLAAGLSLLLLRRGEATSARSGEPRSPASAAPSALPAASAPAVASAEPDPIATAPSASMAPPPPPAPSAAPSLEPAAPPPRPSARPASKPQPSVDPFGERRQ